jgi:glycosidase
MRGSRFLLVLACCAVNCVGAAQAAEAVLDFATAGGDAWTFSKRVTGRVDTTQCDDVYVQAPGASVIAIIDGTQFSAEVPLRSGSNELRAFCRRNGTEVARSDPQRWVTRIEDRPRAWIRVRVDGPDILMDAGRSEMAPGTAASIQRYEWRSRTGNPAPLAITPTGQSIRIKAPAIDGEYYVTLGVTDALGRSDESTGIFEVIAGVATEVDLERHRPAWTHRAVLYGASPFAFGKQGYDDVRKRLADIAALGVSAIWLSPITAAPADDFGYAVTDHFRARAEFGSEQQLRTLIAAAHSLSLRVIMDFVPNHFSIEHRYYADVERNQRQSPYFGWFEREEGGEVTHYFDWPHLKNLDYDNPEVRNYMIAAFSHWVREFDVDGFRVDVGWGVRERAPEFWPRWREELKRIDPDLLLIAEASALDRFYIENGFDAAYDWSTKLGEWAWHDVFASEQRPNLQRLRAALEKSIADERAQALVLRFLNNNDTGARFITRYGVEQARLAATMLFTLPGLPLVYNGDEVGAQFEPYEEQLISWRDRAGLLPHYQKLIKLRSDVAALSSPRMEILKTDHDESVLAYIRKSQSNATDGRSACAAESDVLVLLNFSDQPIEVRIRSSGADAMLERRTLVDLVKSERLSTGSTLPISLDAYAGRVLCTPGTI